MIKEIEARKSELHKHEKPENGCVGEPRTNTTNPRCQRASIIYPIFHCLFAISCFIDALADESTCLRPCNKVTLPLVETIGLRQ